MGEKSEHSSKTPLTLRNNLVQPKDKLDLREGVYSIDCKNCEQKYIDEIKRKLAVRVTEHKEVEHITRSTVYTRDSRN